jgi:transcriptional regulator with XRE-family HTH domain
MKRVTPQAFSAEPQIGDAAHLGAAIRAARTTSGLSIDSAALSLGVSRNTLRALEHGAPTIALGTALRIATQLGIALFFSETAHSERIRRLIQRQRADAA